MWIRRLLPVAAASVLVGALAAGCGSALTPDEVNDAVGSAAPTPATAPPAKAAPSSVVPARGGVPSPVPDPDLLLTTQAPVTVIEGPKQPTELCLGGVLTSLPPQCGGPRLLGFDWAEHRGDFERAAGVTFGDFLVEGHYDGARFTATRVVAAKDFVEPDRGDEPERTTPCPAPPGGWRVLDPARTTEQTMERVFAAAQKLPGYADAWMDSSRNPMTEEKAKTEEDYFAMNDPAYATVNVRVTKDVAGAEKTLRKIWGGALCVSGAAHTDRELRNVQAQLAKLPAVLSAGGGDGVVEVYVTYDDGTLQAWADRKFGKGLVRIGSALVPVKG